MAQGTKWCLTLNNYTEDQYTTLLNFDCKFIIIGKEVGEQGTPHLQCFIHFKKNHRLAAVRRVSPGHWELAKGDTAANIKYCSKDGHMESRGTPAKSRAAQKEDQKEHWADVIKSAKLGTVEADFPGEFVRYNSALVRMYAPTLSDIDEYSGSWYVGPPGCGKSRQARLDFPGAYDKLPNKWWDNYAGEENVLIDDLGKDHTLVGSYLKRYCDHYPFRAEFKGGSKMIRPKAIIITSNYTIEEIWPEDEQLQLALNRRFKVKVFPAVVSE